MERFAQYLDENNVFARIMDIRKRVNPSLLTQVQVGSVDEAMNRGVIVVQTALAAMAHKDISADQIEPGFGPGLLARLYAYALILCSADPDDTTLTPADRFLGLVSATLSKIGLCFADRYNEQSSLTGYAEKSGLFVSDFLFDASLVSADERDIITYAIAAQTHYGELKEGSLRKVPPYDEEFAGKRLWPVMLVRWPGRLCNVEDAFVLRHWITRALSLNPGHIDFGIDGFHDSKFAAHMNPVLDKSTHTMLYHLQMFIDSQADPKLPYGKHDFGMMLKMLDIFKPQMSRIVQAVQKPHTFSSTEQEKILFVLGEFMIVLDGSKHAPDAVKKIMGAFRGLDEPVRNSWLTGFIQMMYEHVGWYDYMYPVLTDMPEAWMSLPTICDYLPDYLAVPKSCIELVQESMRIVINSSK